MSGYSKKVYIIGLLITMFFWAGSFIAVKIGLEQIGPYNLAFYRFIIASPILLILVYLKGSLRSFEYGDLFRIFILAMTGVTLLYAVQFLAMVYTTATNSSILINTSVLFIASISIYLGERFSKLKVVGIVLSFFGIIMIVSKGYDFHFFSSNTIVGDLLMILDGFLWAVYTLVGKTLLDKYEPEVLTAYAFVVGAVLLLPFAMLEGIADPFMFNLNTWGSILFLSVFCSVIAYVIWYAALTRMETTRVAVFVYIVPLFTVIMAFSILDEHIGFFTVLGGVLTMVGLYVTERY